MPESATASEASRRRFLMFRVGDRLYALPAEQVSEVIRTPAVARVPQAPKCLLGLANLRGTVLPVATARGLLGQAEKATAATDRAIVLDGGAPVALAVDGIDGLVSVEAARIEAAELARDEGEALTGAFQAEGRSDVARILDVRSLLEAAFVPRQRPQHRAGLVAAAASSVGEAASEAREQIVTFEVADQEYGLPLATVREIIPAPEGVAVVPRSEALVVGVMAYRETLLPLLSLRGLLGLPNGGDGDGRDKVLVTSVGGALVGLVADRMRAIVSVNAGDVDPTPPMLAARTGSEARVKAIWRGEAGRRLVSILAPEQLFREDVMARLGEAGVAAPAAAPEASGEMRQFLVFRLGEDEFGLPIEAVDEVARAPAQVTRVPKTPKFLEGVINLRGEVLPVVDQRKRFDMAPALDRDALRLIVLRTERHRAGIIVDGVTEVLRWRADAIEEAPHLTGEATRLVHGVVNIEAAGRMVLLLDPGELLTRAERGLLDAFKPEVDKVGS